MIKRLLIFTLGALAVAIAIASLSDLGQAGATNLDLVAAKRGFGIRATPVPGLYPGSTKPLTLRITNPYGYSIRVLPVTAAVVRTTNRAGCLGIPANVTVSTRGIRAAVIRRKATKTLTLHVTMPRTVADSCQGATFRITFKARAVKA
jgi:hypothetical protein